MTAEVRQVDVPSSARALSTLARVDYCDAFLFDVGSTHDASAEDLLNKQTALDGLQDSLGQVDELAKRTAWQYESLQQNRQDLASLRKDMEGVYASHASAVQLRDRRIQNRCAIVMICCVVHHILQSAFVCQLSFDQRHH